MRYVHCVKLFVIVLNRKPLACAPFPSTIGRNASQYYTSKVVLYFYNITQLPCRKHPLPCFTSNVLQMCPVCNSLFWKVRNIYFYYCSLLTLDCHLIPSHTDIHVLAQQMINKLDNSNRSLKQFYQSSSLTYCISKTKSILVITPYMTPYMTQCICTVYVNIM